MHILQIMIKHSPPDDGLPPPDDGLPPPVFWGLAKNIHFNYLVLKTKMNALLFLLPTFIHLYHGIIQSLNCIKNTFDPSKLWLNWSETKDFKSKESSVCSLGLNYRKELKYQTFCFEYMNIHTYAVSPKRIWRYHMNVDYLTT